MKKLAKQSAGWWLFLGIVWTVIFFIKLYEMEWYKSNITWVAPGITALLFYGIALAIVIARKIQNDHFKKEQSKSES